MEKSRVDKQQNKSTSVGLCALFGQCDIAKRILETKPWKSKWAPTKFGDAVLRGIGQIGFANSPLSGLLIVASLSLINPTIGAATLSGAMIANLVALVLHQPDSAISNGLISLNGSLVATATLSIFGNYKLAAWILAASGSLISVPLTIGLQNIFSSTKLDIPIFSLPYNIIELGIAAVLIRGRDFSSDDSNAQNLNSNISLILPDTNRTEEFDVLVVYHGVIVGVGQMYAVSTLAGSYAIAVAIFICSPILAFSAVYGSAVTSVLALVIEPDSEVQKVHEGLWGYDGALMATAMSLFYAPTASSFLLMTSGLVMNVVFKHTLYVFIFKQANLPMFSFPFVILTPIFLAIGNAAGFEGLKRTDGSQNPEEERKKYRYRKDYVKSPVEEQ